MRCLRTPRPGGMNIKVVEECVCEIFNPHTVAGDGDGGPRRGGVQRVRYHPQ